MLYNAHFAVLWQYIGRKQRSRRGLLQDFA
jgi:hypothetical protein